jgi:hypothetical protein
MFRVGSRYLPYSCPISEGQYSLAWKQPSGFFYGTITLYGASFQRTSNGRLGSTRRHIHPAFPRGVRFALCRFRSPLLTASQLLSFPPPNKMLQFSGFRLHEGVSSEEDTKSHSVIPGSRAACTSPGHIAACHDLRPYQSLAIP